MDKQHHTTTTTTENSPERILSQAAEDALGICSVAQMLARDDVDCDDPPAAALLIAKQANELNETLDELSRKIAKGNSADEPQTGNGADDPTKALFCRLRKETENLTVDECVKELRASQIHVVESLSAHQDFEDRYTATHGWSEKGLRYAVALARLEATAYSETG